MRAEEEHHDVSTQIQHAQSKVERDFSDLPSRSQEQSRCL